MNNKKIVLKVKKIVVLPILIIALLCTVMFICAIFSKQVTYAYKENKIVKEISSENQIDIDVNNILTENIKENIKEEINTEEMDLEYKTVYQDDENLAKGDLQTIQEGRTGKQLTVTKKTYEGDNLVKEECVGNKITKAATNKIVLVGTAKNVINYKIQVGDDVYTTPETLSVMLEPNSSSEKIITLPKESKVKTLEIQNEWCKIQYENYIGWTEKNSLKSIKQEKNIEKSDDVKNKNNKVQALNRNIALNKPSNLTLEQFKKILSNDSKDTKKIFEKNAQYFYYAEKQYNINGVFLAAVGIHESNWGTSKISTEKKNLFGYGAYDRAPYDSAYNFSNYSESIDLLARVFIKHYLNKAGSKIYNNEIATGKYYNGSDIDSVNKKYATDSNWGNNVYKWMQYLYNKL